MSSQYVLVKASIDYADEFDCKMFWVGARTAWENTLERAKKSFAKDGELTVCFGTNEELTFSNYDDWVGSFTVIDLTDAEGETLKKFFPQPFGTGSNAFSP